MGELELIDQVASMGANGVIPIATVYIAIMTHRLEKKFTDYFLSNELHKQKVDFQIKELTNEKNS